MEANNVLVTSVEANSVVATNVEANSVLATPPCLSYIVLSALVSQPPAHGLLILCVHTLRPSGGEVRNNTTGSNHTPQQSAQPGFLVTGSGGTTRSLAVSHRPGEYCQCEWQQGPQTDGLRGARQPPPPPAPSRLLLQSSLESGLQSMH